MRLGPQTRGQDRGAPLKKEGAYNTDAYYEEIDQGFGDVGVDQVTYIPYVWAIHCIAYIHCSAMTMRSAQRRWPPAWRRLPMISGYCCHSNQLDRIKNDILLCTPRHMSGFKHSLLVGIEQ